MDWNLLAEEEFVDLFLRNLHASPSLEADALVQACATLLQPSPGGMIAAAVLRRHERLGAAEFSDFVRFTLRGSANGWRPLDWPDLAELLEDSVFSDDVAEPAWCLASLMSRGWVKHEHQTNFFRRIWQTNRIALEEKNLFFSWLYGRHQWADLPKAPSSYPDETFSLKIAYRLSARRGYRSRRILTRERGDFSSPAAAARRLG